MYGFPEPPPPSDLSFIPLQEFPAMRVLHVRKQRQRVCVDAMMDGGVVTGRVEGRAWVLRLGKWKNGALMDMWRRIGAVLLVVLIGMRV